IVGVSGYNGINSYGYDIFIVDSLISEIKNKTNYLDPVKFLIYQKFNDPVEYNLPISNGNYDFYPFSGIEFSHLDVIFNGPQGLDFLTAIDEIWFRDKKIVLNLSQDLLTITVEDFILSEKFSSDWWSYFAPGSTTDDLIGWL
ncbi:MAG: hypothetical protein LBE21_10590, partial [Pseudomonadales bacterium]|nr:hypothetical protein [Pseudomonadales bacterium]